MTTLAEKMKVLEDLHDQYNALEQEIKDEVMALGQSQQVGRVKATFYPNGQGKWDWESWAKTYSNGNLNFDKVVEQYTETKITIKWNKVVDELTLGGTKQLQELENVKERFYISGNPFVSVSVK